QRITTKLKHNNCNHRGSLGLKTPRVGSPFEALVSFVAHCLPMIFKTNLLENTFYAKASLKHTSNTKSYEVSSQNS
ncbi:hypothetical protein, partial [Vibrio cholerae]|uniref:hypothetical protein n=1 Tax=Vibrio cholerae TaxID=666 RepID=UPI00308059E9